MLAWPQKITVGAPSLLDSRNGMRTLSDCLRYPLLQDRDRQDWPAWLKSSDIHVDASVDRGLSFESDLLFLRAVNDSLGLAIVHDIHAHEDLRAGRIVRVLPTSRSASSDDYFVCQPAQKRLRKVAVFCDWLIKELRLCCF